MGERGRLMKRERSGEDPQVGAGRVSRLEALGENGADSRRNLEESFRIYA